MAVTRLLHFIPESGLCRNQTPLQHLKYSIRKDTLHLSVDRIPSLTSDHNLLAQNLSDCIRRPICSPRYRNNVLKCRCSLLPDPNITTPCMKAATAAMTGPNSPYIANLVMAVGAVVFVLWGLQPLVRTTRNMFLNKDDTNWKKSTTHYVLTSYLQPVLLWGGAMLVCRALDPVIMPTKASRLIKQRVVTFVRSLSTILTFAYCLSCAVQRAHKVFVETNEHSDAGSMGFHLAGKAVYTSVWIAAVSLFMELLGFSTKKWLTAGGLGTVLLTLAGREIFTNFLSSVIIQTTRPFVVNEWIQTRIEGYEVSGTVEDVGWWSPTVIRGEDREAVYIPNHKFTVNIVRNLSQKNHWRIRASLAISHLDVNKINTIVADMRKVLAKNPQVEQQKLHRRVFLDTINPENQALTILVSCFVKTSHHEEYLCVKEAILLDLLRVIRHHGARLATPIRTIQKHYSDPDIDMDNIPFSESVFSREMSPSHPFFLIEPSYKVNGEDYAKARIARSGGGQESTSDSPSETGDSKTDATLQEKSASESSKSGFATLDQDCKALDAKVRDKSASQSRTGETSKSGIAELDQDNKASRPQSNTISNSDKKTSSGDAEQSVKMESPVSSSEGIDRQSSKASQSKQMPGQPRSAVEENIVLEVALDGLKRTLPVDEYRPSTSATPIEAKEVATNRNSNEKGDGTPRGDKDE